MKKNQLLTRIAKSWSQLKNSYEGMAELQMTQAGSTGDWSVKDILAHVTTWEQEALKNLPLIAQGKQPPRYKDLYGGLDQFNAFMTEKKRGLSLTEVMSQMETVHQQLVSFITNMPDELLISETRFLRRLRLDTYGHYPLHAKAILEIRSSLTQD